MTKEDYANDFHKMCSNICESNDTPKVMKDIEDNIKNGTLQTSERNWNYYVVNPQIAKILKGDLNENIN